MRPLLNALVVAAIATTLGTALAADQYDLSVAKPEAKAKARASAKISIRPKGAYHVNTEFPVKLKLTAPAGVSLEKDIQRGGDAARFDKTGLDFDVGFTADGAGTKSFTGELKFAVCTDTDCKPTTEALSFDIDVK